VIPVGDAMSTAEIGAGDLVMIVEAHCVAARNNLLGQIHTVRRIIGIPNVGSCPNCGAPREQTLSAELTPGKLHPVKWLRKINPTPDKAEQMTRTREKERRSD